MPTERTAPSYTNGRQVLASYLASEDDRAWVVVATASLDAVPDSLSFGAYLVERGKPNVQITAGLTTLDIAHSVARMHAESLRDQARGLPGPVGA